MNSSSISDIAINMTMFNNTNTTPRLTIVNSSIPSNHYPNTATTATIPTTHSTIDDFREIVREQSFTNANNSDSNSIDVPIKRYPPLPDINAAGNFSMSNAFYRTEAVLIQSKQTPSKKQIFHHFAPATRGTLPAMNKRPGGQTVTDAMDLDEDLPQNMNASQRAATYTSPGERIISPIKRPSAPSPPASAQVKRPGQNAYEDDDDEQIDEQYDAFGDEDSRYFDEQSCDNYQVIPKNYHRIDHYNPNPRYAGTYDRHTTNLVINGGYDEPSHPLDSRDFEM